MLLRLLYTNPQMAMRSSRMDKIYVHDDQIGPNARMTFNTGYFDTEWTGRFNPAKGSRIAKPTLILVPVYHKIRITYNEIISHIDRIDSTFKLKGHYSNSLEWAIYLTTVNQFKSDIFANGNMDPAMKRVILQLSLPKYLWRATGILKNKLELDLLFDATDIKQGITSPYRIPYSKSSLPALTNIVRI